MRAGTALSLIKNIVTSGPALTRNIAKPSKGEYINPFLQAKWLNHYKGRWYRNLKKVYEEKKELITKAMSMCRSGQPVRKSKMSQPGLIDYEGLPWPLSVPWSGSFVTSANPSRDFPRHAMYGLIEEYIVPLYRVDMIQNTPEIGVLRDDISDILRQYLSDEDYTFPDKIQTPERYEVRRFSQFQTVLHSDRLTESFSKYNNQVEDIIKSVAKHPVLLANPFGDKDSVVVREAFEGFIQVSGSVCLSDSKVFI